MQKRPFPLWHRLRYASAGALLLGLLSGTDIPAAQAAQQPVTVAPAAQVLEHAAPIPANTGRQLEWVVPLRTPALPTAWGALRLQSHRSASEQIAQAYGASRAVQQAAIHYFRAHGLQAEVTSDQRALRLWGKPDAFAQAFQTHLAAYAAPTGDRFFAATQPLHVPRAVASALGPVAPLSTEPVLHPLHLTGQNLLSLDEKTLADLRSWYQVDGLGDGDGVQTAVLGGGMPDAAGVQRTLQAAGLPQGQYTVQPVSADASAQQVLTEEPTLDVVALLAMAPKSTLTYYALAGSTDGSLDESSFYDGVEEILQRTPLPQVVSFSYGGPESGHDPAIDQLLQELWAAGVIVAASSGDAGAAVQDGGAIGVLWPASHPAVVGVGGTAFQSGVPQEVAWAYSGGGFSSVYPASAEQAEATGQSRRAVPDMAMYAAGIPLFYKGMEETVAGTSLAAPLWAGVYADLVGALPDLAQTPPQLWINALGVGALHHAWTTAPFHDITQGDNVLTSGQDAGTGYHAGPGFDEVTGWGSFNASATRTLLAQMPTDGLQLTVEPSVSADHQVQLTLTVTAQGLPVPGAAVQLRLPDGRPLPQDAWVQPPSIPATTDETGQWEATLAIDKLSDPEGHLEVQAQQGMFAGTTSVSLHPIATDTVGGADRYATSSALLSDPAVGWTSGPSDKVILVNGRPGHEIDGLAANSLAGALHAPVMVVDGNASALTEAQKGFLSKLSAKQALVVGLSLGDDLLQQLKQMGLNVDEKTFRGDNRYDTANRVAEYIYGQTNASPKAVFVARGDALPDALSVGSLAAGEADVVLLQGPNDADWQETVTLAKRFGVHIYVLGGPKVVPDAVQQALGADLIYGSDRYDTNLQLLDKWRTAFGYDTLYITNGAPGHEVDALSVGSVAGQKTYPILLVNGSSLTEDQKRFLSDNAGKVQRVVFVGGSGVFASGFADQVTHLLQEP